MLDPQAFIRNKLSLTLLEAKKLQYLGPTLIKNTNQPTLTTKLFQQQQTFVDNRSFGTSSHKTKQTAGGVSIAKTRWQFNPLHGYSVASIKAIKPNTVVYRVKAAVFDRFLHASQIENWGERELITCLPPQIRIESCTKKQQEQLLNTFQVREY